MPHCHLLHHVYGEQRAWKNESLYAHLVKLQIISYPAPQMSLSIHAHDSAIYHLLLLSGYSPSATLPAVYRLVQWIDSLTGIHGPSFI